LPASNETTIDNRIPEVAIWLSNPEVFIVQAYI